MIQFRTLLVHGSLFLLSFLFGLNSLAGMEVYKNVPDRKSIILKMGPEDSASTNTILEASHGGETCPLEVSNVKGKWVAASTAECPFADQLQPGDAVTVKQAPAGPAPKAKSRPKAKEKEEASEEAYPRNQTTKSEKKVTRHHLGGALYYSMADTVYERLDASGQGFSTSTKSTYKSGGALGLELNYRYLKRSPHPTGEPNLGAMVGYFYDLPRKITSSQDDNGNTQTYTDLSMNVSGLEANGIVEIFNFYGIAGFNYSFISQSGKDKSDYLTYKGTMGVQFGGGYWFDPCSVELLFRSINGTVSGTDSFGTAYQSQYERLWGLLLRANVYFSL